MKRRSLRRLAAWAAAVVVIAVSNTAPAASAAAPEVRLPPGRVIGQYLGTDNSVAAFFGIYYAQSPTGNQRFAPPQPLAKLPTDPFMATNNSIACEQATPNVAYTPTPVLTENCLILNVWTAANFRHQRRPVMVYFHGGGNSTGNSNPYHGYAHVANGVVLVTVNYRVGAFGFLPLAALDAANANGVSGNQGIQDQQLALRWVHDNIARFGGDPDNVTIDGVSAGANDIAAHLVAKGSAGLFGKAIVESLVGPGPANITLAQAEANQLASIHRADTAATPLGCAAAEGNAPALLACLRGLPAAALVSLGAAGEFVDGVIVGAFPPTAFAAGTFNRVSIMMGSNQTEGTFFHNVTVTEAGYQAFLQGLFPVAAYGAAGSAALVAYVENTLYPSANYPTPDFPAGSPSMAAAVVTGDSGVVCNAENMRALLAKWVRVHGYEFNQPAPVEQVRMVPAAGIVSDDMHTTEIAYVFDIDSQGRPLTGLGATGLPAGTTSQFGNGSLYDEALSRSMNRYWTRFARTGDPTGFDDDEGDDSHDRGDGANPSWPSYSTRYPLIQSLINNSFNAAHHEIAPEITFSAKHNCAFWASPQVGGGAPGNHLIAPAGPN
jgi:para-nitrobenzyl esterase